MPTTIAQRVFDDAYQRAVTAAVIADTDKIRCEHLTPVTAKEAPVVDFEMGDDLPQSGKICEKERRLQFEVCIQVRNDASNGAADEIITAVLSALDPTVAPYPAGARLGFYAIRRPKPEIADADVTEVRIEFEARYTCAGWALDALPSAY